ncbi:hypothetical protein BDN70DRAFT_593483 [Pholiota conissans]|uniref:Uncharacterized protein n=1 Tax=Pholiota conissans TaxID=109636 RepID=A0A9P6CZT6_9AGAR|nr:hypothetical protein BDN70DRAFT_593483 [Pholiota conissans]
MEGWREQRGRLGCLRSRRWAERGRKAERICAMTRRRCGLRPCFPPFTPFLTSNLPVPDPRLIFRDGRGLQADVILLYSFGRAWGLNPSFLSNSLRRSLVARVFVAHTPHGRRFFVDLSVVACPADPFSCILIHYFLVLQI